MVAEGKARHALFEGFEETIKSESYLDDPDILGRTCPGYVESARKTVRVCQTSVLKKNSELKKEDSAIELWQRLSATTDIKDTEKFVDEVKKLIHASHCGNHTKPKRLGIGLQKWREDQLARYLRSSNVTSEVPPDHTHSQESFLDCGYNSEVDGTPSPEAAFCGRVANAEVESFDNNATKLEVHPSTEKVLSTRITVSELSVSGEIALDPVVGSNGCKVQKNEASPMEAAQMMSALTLNDKAGMPRLFCGPEPTLNNDDDTRRVKKEDVQELKNIGAVAIKESMSNLDNSEVVRNFCKKFTAKDEEKGVLYVLEKTKAPGIFKIGWSRLSAEERCKQANNCCAKDTKIIYKSSTAFQGAYRAETCTHALLKHKKVELIKCAYCPVRHREYFEVTEVEVLRIVKIVEKIVKLPGYVYNDRKQAWQLSDAASTVIDAVFGINLDLMEAMVREQELAATTATVDETPETESISASNNTTIPIQHSESGGQVTQLSRTRRSTGKVLGSALRAVKDIPSAIRRSLTAESNEVPSSLSKTLTRSISSPAAQWRSRSDAAVEVFWADFKEAYEQPRSTRE